MTKLEMKRVAKKARPVAESRCYYVEIQKFIH